ncbi:hypothetical protein FHT39_004930 [Mitsuaria sp. BK045]|uniref:DUF3311 domain-containing protein n=1 Tax=unclassified Roseateles TaxID=2626991 RepID=UPI00161D3D99|nr:MULTISPECIES: DUF3311 domain-containing protein [unclassified Roseateles]MBB3296251.1 hypothetical protein [Mitsuaria sp. BK041]MBB3365466.1 hypothetical protein [Mitsuaria sp. BK045]
MSDTHLESPSRRHRWLALLPVLHALAGVTVANRVQPFVLGLPFFMAWTIAGMLLTALVMAAIYRLDPANRGDAEAAPDLGDDVSGNIGGNISEHIGEHRSGNGSASAQAGSDA